MKTFMDLASTVVVKRLPYHGPRESRQENMGWLSIWWIAECPGSEPPARRQYCSKREVAGILRYWQSACFALMKHEFVSEEPSVLDKILAETPLERILKT